MKRRYILCLVLAILGVMLLLGAATVQPGRPISQYPRVTTLQGTDIFVVARTNVSPATNMGATWIVITNDVFLMVSNYVNSSTSGFTSIPLGYQTNAWTTNVAGTPVIGASSLSISNATTNFNFYGLDSNTVARLGEIGSATNAVLTTVTNLISSATNGLATLTEVTNIVNVASTNNVKVTAGTNIVVVTNVSGNTITYQVNNAIDTNIFATTNFVSARLGTNFMNLSVQAAKYPSTNFPAIDPGWQTWDLVYFPTNESGNAFPIDASWQFVVPHDYATNSMKVYMLQTLVSTNGPGTSNTIWRASIFRATSGDTTDTHIGTFGTAVWGTNTWTASTSNTNKVQALVIDLSTNSLLQSGDLAVLKIERVNTNDTYRGSSALVGLQLQYSRQ